MRSLSLSTHQKSIGFLSGLITPLLITVFYIKPRFDRILLQRRELQRYEMHDLQDEINRLNWHLKILDNNKSLLHGKGQQH